MKLLIALLILVLLFLQYKLWVEHNGLGETWQLRKEVVLQKQQNNKLTLRNQALIAEVKDLKQGHQAIEERARSELGMVQRGEQFFQIVDDGSGGQGKK